MLFREAGTEQLRVRVELKPNAFINTIYKWCVVSLFKQSVPLLSIKGLTSSLQDSPPSALKVNKLLCVTNFFLYLSHDL